MVPSTPIEVILVLAFLTPGFVFLQSRELRHARRSYSVLRETALVVITSGVCNLVVFLVLLYPSTFIPSFSVDALIRRGSEYLLLRHKRILIWTGVGLVLSSCLAYLLSAPPKLRCSASSGVLKRFCEWLDEQRGHRQLAASAWSLAFHDDCGDDERCRVGIEDVSGHYMEGDLVRFSPNLDEDENRTLTLGGDIRLRTKGSTELAAIQQHRLVIPAQQVARLYVTYLKKPGE